MSECFIVVHRNYAEGTDAYAFWSEKWAKKSVNEDVNTEFTSLCIEGYNPIILRRTSGATVYVNDTDIYYEWEILKTTIEGEMPPLGSRDKELEELWVELSDVTIDPETERTEEAFLHFPAGTDREDIWHWFDERHSKGVAYLLYGGAEDYVPESRRLYGLKGLCTECDSESCVFNPHGVCLAPFVTGHAPTICDDGCGDYCYKEA